jgi:hypothetical protein
MKTSNKKVKSPAPATIKPKSIKEVAPKKVTEEKPKKPRAIKLPPAKVSKVTLHDAPTYITALIDVGFGNKLYVRGNGSGLTWDRGLELKNEGSSQWSVVLPASRDQVSFKLLINDTTWNLGDDYTASPGSHVTVSPLF